ncbi:hypothetical protein J3Q64DRAFT_1762224 [Phycomyces blakesleeanus]|uniref:Uncharacterized protein n=1 Tax=Phycomyces blakesleeanus TaxID=4837 RepID=A0ABR3AT67_PHYBL
MREMTKATKFDDAWLGPFVVTQVNRYGTYWLDGEGGKRLNGAGSVDMLKRWVAPTSAKEPSRKAKKKFVEEGATTRVGDAH